MRFDRLHKELIVLGLIERAPQHGHELHRIVRAHGELYADLKKANLYHLLSRLEQQGCLTVKSQPGTRGRRGERLVYGITAKGRKRFMELLRRVLQDYASAHTGIEVAAVFIPRLGSGEALKLLAARREKVAARQSMLERDFAGFDKRGPAARISADHVLSMNAAELAWVDRSLATLSHEPPAPGKEH